MLTASSRFVVVDRPVVNPCCCEHSRELLFTCFNMLFDIILSMTLHTIEVSDTGL